MNVAYVSALYNIYEKDIANTRLIADVQKLLAQPFELILFVDDFYLPIVSNFQAKGKNVNIIHKPTSDLHIYNMLMDNKDKLTLPTKRNPEKDTHSYMALMHQKVEFLLLAKELTDKEYIAWIDAGSSKMLKDENSYIRLKNYHLINFENVLIPGCYLYPRSFQELCEMVYWNFLGTFYIVHRNYVQTFYEKSLQALSKFSEAGRITWEVNVWIYIMQTDYSTFTWYSADHNDSFTHLPLVYST